MDHLQRQRDQKLNNIKLSTTKAIGKKQGFLEQYF